MTDTTTTLVSDAEKQRAAEAAKAHGGGLRFNSGKMMFSLIPREWTYALAYLLTKGAFKYAPRNWEKGMSWSDTLDCLYRHLDKWLAGETYDPETGSHHLVQVAWNALVLFTMQIRGIGKDDIPRPAYVLPIMQPGLIPLAAN